MIQAITDLSAHPIEAHPLRAESLRLDVALARAGIKAVSPQKRWRPWAWDKQQKLYWRLNYVPSPGQRAFHQCARRFRVICAGARFGKSMLAARDLLPIILTPGTNCAVIGPTYDLAEKEWRYIHEDIEALGLKRFAKTWSMGKPGLIEFIWGSRVHMRSADNPASLLGEEYDGVILSEASQLDRRIWHRYIRPRMGSRLGRVLIPTTPSGLNWVREEFDRGVIQLRDGIRVDFAESAAAWQFSVLENPTFDPVEYLSAQSTLPEEEFAEQYDGRFTAMSGRLFPHFTRKACVVESPPQELHGLPVFRSVDFGFSNPSVCLWVVYDAAGVAGAPPRTWWVVGEIYRRQLVTEDLAKQIRSHPWTVNHRIIATIGDMADAQGRATLARHGVPCQAEMTRQTISEDANKEKPFETVPIQKAWDAGIRTLRAVMKQGRLRVAGECKETIRELLEATFADDGSGKNKDKQTLGQDDHAIDALRYLVHTVTPV